jgi:hypothetical protein
LEKKEMLKQRFNEVAPFLDRMAKIRMEHLDDYVDPAYKYANLLISDKDLNPPPKKPINIAGGYPDELTMTQDLQYLTLESNAV